MHHDDRGLALTTESAEAQAEDAEVLPVMDLRRSHRHGG